MNTDAKIWNDFLEGKDYALSQIYHENIQLLFRYGKKFSQNDELVKDTIQDLFFDLVRNRKNLGKTDSIRFYLMKSFRRKLVKNIQTYKISQDKTLNEKKQPGIVYSIEEELINKEKLSEKEKLIQKALKELSDKQREIIFYRFFCDFSYDQICEIMNLKYDSARKQLFRSLKTLRKYLSDKDLLILFLCTFFE